MGQGDGSRKHNADFLCRVRFDHTVPPFPPVPVALQLNAAMAEVAHQEGIASLDEETPAQLFSDANLGMTPGLVGLEAYCNLDIEPTELWNGAAELPPEDAALTIPPRLVTENVSGTSGLKALKDPVTWLRRTQYISNETVNQRGPENPVPGISTKRVEDISLRTREQQIEAIEKSFEAANNSSHISTLKHPTKPGVVAAEIIPLFPNFGDWWIDYTQVSFDGEPGIGCEYQFEEEIDPDTKQEMLENAVIEPVTLTEAQLAAGLGDPTNQELRTWLMFYLPLPEELSKLQTKLTFEDFKNDEEGIKYRWIRDYSFVMPPQRQSGEIMFMMRKNTDPALRNEGDGPNVAMYQEVGTRVQLKKRRPTGRMHAPADPSKSTWMHATIRQPNDKELDHLVKRYDDLNLEHDDWERHVLHAAKQRRLAEYDVGTYDQPQDEFAAREEDQHDASPPHVTES